MDAVLLTETNHVCAAHNTDRCGGWVPTEKFGEVKVSRMSQRFSHLCLIGSRWTALSPAKRDRHFVVTGWADTPTDCDNTPDCVTLEAVETGRRHVVLCRTLRKASLWRMGWY